MLGVRSSRFAVITGCATRLHACGRVVQSYKSRIVTNPPNLYHRQHLSSHGNPVGSDRFDYKLAWMDRLAFLLMVELILPAHSRALEQQTYILLIQDSGLTD